MAAIVTSTFTTTGQSSVIDGRSIAIKMDFAGTASVDVEQRINAAWIKIETGITADYSKVFESPVVESLRLNCTSYTNDVVYRMETGQNG
jgi:hypothetical protein